MKEELIGKRATIEYAGRTFEGTIINETKNTLDLKTSTKTIRVIKKNSVITTNGKKIKGEQIAKRPEDRIKAC